MELFHMFFPLVPIVINQLNLFTLNKKVAGVKPATE